MLLKKMKKESMEMLRMVYVGRKRGSAVLTHPLSSRREFPWQSIWKVRAPSNIAINICMDGTHGQNMKIDNLVGRRNFMVKRCCMSIDNEETVPHHP